jgi:hypothetical protein
LKELRAQLFAEHEAAEQAKQAAAAAAAAAAAIGKQQVTLPPKTPATSMPPPVGTAQSSGRGASARQPLQPLTPRSAAPALRSARRTPLSPPRSIAPSLRPPPSLEQQQQQSTSPRSIVLPAPSAPTPATPWSVKLSRQHSSHEFDDPSDVSQKLVFTQDDENQLTTTI